MGLVTLCKNYLVWTQAVVVAPLIAGAKRRWLKIAWSLVLVATTAAFVIQSYYLFTNHLAYKTTTNIQVFHETEAPFPAVTFCNLNPFKKSMVAHSQELTNLLATYTYVNKVRQEQLKSGTTATARTTTTSRTESRARRKRQVDVSSGCNKAAYSYTLGSSPSRNYSVWICSNKTALMEFEGCDDETAQPAGLAFDRIAAQVLSSYCGYSDEPCRSEADGKMSIEYSTYGYDDKCDEWMTTVFGLCNNPSQTGNNYNQSLTYAYNFTYDCWRDDGRKCTQNIQCSLANVTEPTSSETPSPSTVPDMTTTPSTSTNEITTAQLTLSSELPTTTSGAFTTNTAAVTTTNEPTTTTTEPVTTTFLPLPSTLETTTMTMAGTADDTSATSSASHTTTTTSEAASKTTDVRTSTLTSLSGTATKTAPFTTASTTTETWTTQRATIALEFSSTEKITTTTEKATSVRTTSSSATLTSAPGATTSTSHPNSATVGETTAKSSTPLPSTASSTTSQAAKTANSSSSEKARASSEKTTTDSMYASLPVSPTAPETAPDTRQTSSTTIREAPTAFAITTEREATSTFTPLTTASAGVPSTEAMFTTVTTTRTGPADSTMSTQLVTSTQESSLTASTGNPSPDTGIDSTLTTTRSFFAMSSSATSPSTVSSFPTTPPTTISSTSSTTIIPTTRRTAHSSTDANGGSTTSSGMSFSETTRAALAPAAVTSTGRTTEGFIIKASTEGVVSSAPSQSTSRAVKPSSTPSSLPSKQTMEPSTESSSRSDLAGTSSITTTKLFESEVTTMGSTENTAQTTENAVSGSSLESVSSMQTQSPPSTAMRHSSNSSKSVSTEALNGSERTTRKGINSTPTTDVAGDEKNRASAPSASSEGAMASQSSNAPSGPTLTPYGRPAEGNGSSRSTLLGPMVTTTTKLTEQGSETTTWKGINSTPTTDVTGDEKNQASSLSANSSTLKSSTMKINVSATPPVNDGSYSITAQASIAVVTSRSKEFPSSAILRTEPTLREHGDKTLPTTTEIVHGGQSSTTKSGAGPTSWQSTARNPDDAEEDVTTVSGEAVFDADDRSDSTRTTGTTAPSDISVDHTTSNGEGDSSNAKYPTRIPDASHNEHTTTSYENYLKNIKLNLGLDFDLGDLSEEQIENLEDLAYVYGLDPSSTLPVVDANMKQALQTIAAKMSLEQRQVLGFQLKDLISSCIMNGDPCDTKNDFMQTFDVDYGNCYTFNYGTPVKYTTRRAGSSYGLRMTVISNSTEILPSSEQGVKIVVHNQDIVPFPNGEGYRSSVGEAASLQLTRSKFAKLGAPYGNCSTLESLAKNKQPFYFNGSYSTEGCFRSCFQRNIATACGCADSRFPSPTDLNVPFCDPLEPTKYKCMEKYIEDKGDYFSVENCNCFDPCEDTSYKSQIFEAPWPVGDFFYGPYCPLAKKLNVDCAEFYSCNAMQLEVSYAQLGYQMLEEEPLSTVWSLWNELAGNSGFWIGYTMVTFVEIFLVTAQICLWCCGCPRLPEVPDPDDDDFSDDDDDSDGSDDSSDDDDTPGPSGAPSTSRIGPPKNFDNSIFETELTRRAIKAMTQSQQDLYGRKQSFEPVVPVIAV